MAAEVAWGPGRLGMVAGSAWLGRWPGHLPGHHFCPPIPAGHLLGPELRVSHLPFPSEQPRELGTVSSPIAHTRKLRHEPVQILGQGHTGRK